MMIQEQHKIALDCLAMFEKETDTTSKRRVENASRPSTRRTEFQPPILVGTPPESTGDDEVDGGVDGEQEDISTVPNDRDLAADDLDECK
jgi:hypothetical protein